jgi:hypothetical protein
VTLHDLLALEPVFEFLVALISLFIALRILWKHPQAGPWFVIRLVAAFVAYVAVSIAGILVMHDLARPPAPPDVALTVGIVATAWIIFNCCILVRYLRRLQSMSISGWLPWFEAALLSGVCSGVLYVVMRQQT